MASKKAFSSGPKKLTYPDVLGQDWLYLVLTKKNRLQVLVRPKKSLVRYKGQKEWNIAAAINGDDEAAAQHKLGEAVAAVVKQEETKRLEKEVRASEKEKKKAAKKAKKKAKHAES